MKLGKRREASSEPQLVQADRVTFEVPMPPSTNALYVRRRGKRGAVALSDVARAYRETVKQIVSRQLISASRIVTNADGYGSEIYGVEIVACIPELENPAWFEGKTVTRGQFQGQLRVKLRYKRIDIDNRIKFVQDWVTKCVGMADDSIVFENVARKVEASQESMSVSIYKLDRAGFLPPRGDPEWLKEWRERNAES